MNRRLLMVAPGLQPVPPVGWGAIESLVDELRTGTHVNGGFARVSNSRSRIAPALHATRWSPDVVHVHWDPYIPRWRSLRSVRFRYRLIATTHSSRVNDPNWSGSLPNLLNVDGHIALTARAARSLRDHGFRGPIIVVGNGVDTTAFKVCTDSGNGRAICIGRLEDRKRQNELSELAVRFNAPLDFVGPGDPRELTLSSNVRYLGVWDRNEVRARLTEYSAVVLASKSELDPLVIKEALAAAVPVVITSESAAVPESEAVRIIELGREFCRVIYEICSTDDSSIRRQARDIAVEEFDWSVICQRYLDAVGVLCNSDPTY